MPTFGQLFTRTTGVARNTYVYFTKRYIIVKCAR